RQRIPLCHCLHLPAFLHFDRGGFEFAERAAVQVQLINGVHAISNLLSGKNLRTPEPHGAWLESIGPGKSTFVLSFPEHEVSQLVRGDNAPIRARERKGAARGGSQ